MGMSARAAAQALVILFVCTLLGCKENIPRPPGELDDAGDNPPADVSSLDGPESQPDVAPPATCGTGGLPCCAGNVCTGGGCCVGGLCVANGTPCRADATCLEGSCGGCGAAMPKPQECCASRACTASRTICQGAGTGMCQACGRGGQSCCGDGFCEGNLRCDTSAGAPGACVAK
jgi:hypothetical protein